MSINGSARAFSVSTTDRNLTGHAGAVLIRAAAHAVGLGNAIAAHLQLKKRARGLSEANSILAMAEAVALGATCLDDLAIVRPVPKAEDRGRHFIIKTRLRLSESDLSQAPVRPSP